MKSLFILILRLLKHRMDHPKLRLHRRIQVASLDELVSRLTEICILLGDSALPLFISKRLFPCSDAPCWLPLTFLKTRLVSFPLTSLFPSTTRHTLVICVSRSSCVQLSSRLSPLQRPLPACRRNSRIRRMMLPLVSRPSSHPTKQPKSQWASPSVSPGIRRRTTRQVSTWCFMVAAVPRRCRESSRALEVQAARSMVRQHEMIG